MKRASFHNLTAAVLVVSLIFSGRVFGETSSSSSSGSSSQAVAGALAGVNAASNSGMPAPVAIPPAPQIKPPEEPQQQQQSDRKEGQGAAAAMAAVGAAIAGASCMMMMAQAQKMPPGPEKNQMMMMAMQQCAQAAQSAANAAQNKDGEKKLKADPPPKMAELAPAAQIQVPKQEAEKNLLGENTETESEEEVSSTEEFEIPDTSITAPEMNLTSNAPKAVVVPEVKGFAQSYSSLNPIEKANQTFDENAKNGAKTPSTDSTTGTAGSFTFAPSGTGISSDLLKKINLAQEGIIETGDSRGTGKRGNIGGGEAEALGGGGGSDGGSGSSGGDSQFDQMLAQLMGGGGGPAGEMGGGFSEYEFVQLPTNPKTQQRINIFEYASYRYKYAAYNESRVKLHPTAKRKIASTDPFAAQAGTLSPR
jgi:uncharacterized membrane protein YgcG